MNQTYQDELANTVGTDVGRLALLTEIIAKVERLESTASDDDLDQWWGFVEIDRLASGLTLATITKLSAPGGEDGPAGAWLLKSDDTGDKPTQLTSEGREVIRQICAGNAV